MDKFKVTILDKYIFSQVFWASFVCLFLFVIIWIAPETLVRIIRQIFLEGISLKQAGWNLFYELPKVFDKALPVGILLGSIFTFDKLSKNSELIIIRGIGVKFTRIILPVIFLGVLMTVACFFVGDRLIPFASYKTGESANFHKHFVYVKKDAQKRPEQGVIISDFTPNSLRNLTVLNFSEEDEDHTMRFDSVLFAPYAKKYNDRWVLAEAKLYKIAKNGVYTDIIDVTNFEILKSDNNLAGDVYEIMKNSVVRERGFTSARMVKYINLLKKHEFTDEQNYLMAKFYQRFLHPLTCILFAILGCLLGYAPPRSQRLIGFTAAVGIIFAYYITLPFFDLMAEKSVLPPIITASIPFIAFIVTIFAVKRAKDL